MPRRRRSRKHREEVISDGANSRRSKSKLEKKMKVEELALPGRRALLLLTQEKRRMDEDRG